MFHYVILHKRILQNSFLGEIFLSEEISLTCPNMFKELVKNIIGSLIFIFIFTFIFVSVFIKYQENAIRLEEV